MSDINIKQAVIVYDNFYNSFTSGENFKYSLKRKHSRHVMGNAAVLSKMFDLNEENKRIFIFNGLYHDIGRYPELAMNDGKFNDVQINHSELGVQVLFDKCLIYEAIPNTREYDEIIRTAIANHGALAIPQGLDEQTKFHSNAIRDADKIDILRVFLEDENIISQTIRDNFVSDEVMEYVYNHKLVPHNLSHNNEGKVTNEANKIIAILCYIFDINYSESYKLLQQKDYLNKLFKKFDFTNPKVAARFREVVEEIQKHISTQSKDGIEPENFLKR